MISVVGGVIRDDSGRILLAQRRGGDLDGLWEFPGGKIEAGESAHAALTRELHEELGIEVESSAALIRIPYRYPGKSIALEVRVVQAWSGRPRGREGQALRWMHEGELGTLPMPPADLPAVAALNLPQHIAITPEDATDDATLLQGALRCMQRGVGAIQIRRPSLTAQRNRDVARRLRDAATAEQWRGALLLNGDIDGAERLGLGLHLRSAQLRALRERPPCAGMLTAACHDLAELARATELRIDAALVGAVMPTPTHPDRAALGWDGFEAMRASCALPIYALGGLGPGQVVLARTHGAQGVAGIRAFWD